MRRSLPDRTVTAAKRSPRAARAPSTTEAAGTLLLALPQLMDAFRGVMRRQLDPALSVPQFRALRFVAQSPDASVSELAAFLGVTLPTASAMVDRLLKAELVAARVSARDRRRTELEATARGVALMEQVRRGAQRELAQRLGPLTSDELACVTQALTLLQRSFPHA